MRVESIKETANTLSAECRRAQAEAIIAKQDLAKAKALGDRLCRLLESQGIRDDFQVLDAISEWKEFRQ